MLRHWLFILDKRSKQMDAKVITRYIVLILALVN
ncbi:phage holin, partial [Staphylococcus aureus]